MEQIWGEVPEQQDSLIATLYGFVWDFMLSLTK